MKRLSTFIALLLAGIAATAQPSDAFLLSAMNAGKMPGASMVVIKDGQWILNKNLGKADIAQNKDVTRNTVFMLASVSKTIVATAIMQQWEKGQINLDADINHYLPFNFMHPNHPNDSVTMRMLVTHTSAIKDNWTVMNSLYVNGDSPISLDTFMKHYFVPGGTYYSATSNYYAYAPGTTINYSNMATTLAAYIVQRVTGDDFAHYCDTAIFDKLCMKPTGWKLEHIADTTKIARPYSWFNNTYNDNGLYGYPDYPDGQLRCNITSLARFMTMYMQRGTYNGVRILDTSTVDYMLKQQTPVASNQGIIFYSAPGSSGDMLWGHNGGDAGVATAMYFNIAKKTGAIVLTNGDGSSTVSPDALVDTLYNWGLTVTPAATDTFPACNETTAIAGMPSATGELTISPNPTQGNINVTVPSDAIMMLTDMQGSVKARYTLNTGTNNLQFPSELPAGIYFGQVLTKTGELIGVKKMVLMR